MKISSSLGIVGFILATAGNVSCAFQHLSTNTALPEVAFSISLDKKEYRIGETAYVNILVKNAGTIPRKYYINYELHGFLINSSPRRVGQLTAWAWPYNSQVLILQAGESVSCQIPIVIPYLEAESRPRPYPLYFDLPMCHYDECECNEYGISTWVADSTTIMIKR